MNVLLSIKPEYASRIFAGEKLFEYRRRIFTKSVRKVVVYASAPVSMIIGEFLIEEVIHSDLPSLWRHTHREGGISQQEFYTYFADQESGYAIRIGGAKLYRSPRRIDSYGIKPPQSYVYLP